MIANRLKEEMNLITKAVHTELEKMKNSDMPALAKKTGFSESYLYNLTRGNLWTKKGKQLKNYETILKIAQALGF